MEMTSQPDSLSISIHKALSQYHRWTIVKSYHQTPLSFVEYQNQADKFDAYFENYETLCRQCSVNDVGLLCHSDILFALTLIKAKSKAECLGELKTKLLQHVDILPKLADIDLFALKWLEFTAEALLLIDISAWKDDTTFQDFLGIHLPKTIHSEDTTLSHQFCAMNLDRIGGMKPRWTNTFTDHLSLEREGTQIAIFHQIHALSALRNIGIYPDDLIVEIRKTLDVLFPRFDQRSKKWLKGRIWHKTSPFQALYGKLDPTAFTSNSLRVSQRKLDNFERFHDRLIILKEEYDAHEPQNFFQYWHDHRRPAQWWAFWVAVLVFLFGIIQVVEGGIQCYKAYHPS